MATHIPLVGIALYSSNNINLYNIIKINIIQKIYNNSMSNIISPNRFIL